MYWTKEHDILLVREVLAVDPYSQPKGSRERAKLWEQIAINLNAVSMPRFTVSLRSVRDRVNQVLIKKYKKKVAEETKASGITVDEPSEFDIAMEEICEKAEAAERDLQMMSEERKANLEKEKRQAEDMRAKALEKVGETKKREASDDVKKEKKARRSGADTITYLKERSEEEFKIRQEELELKKQEQRAQAKQQEEITQQLIRQQEDQKVMFANLQKQQSEQLQQLSQMQMAMMQQQQQTQQQLLTVLQGFVSKAGQ